MAIIEYFGKFGKSGQVVARTKCKCACDNEECPFEWITSVACTWRFGSEICRLCKRDGIPYSVKEALLEYPSIIEFLSLGARSDVTHNSICRVRCRRCKEVFEKNFALVKRNPNWICVDCSTFETHGSTDEPVYPQSVIGIVDWEEKTLGPGGRLNDCSLVYFHCPICNRKNRSTWGGFQHGTNRCHKCGLTESWKDEETRNKRLTAIAAAPTRLSKEHAKFKQFMEERGVVGFSSEQRIDRCIVDELNGDLIIEYYGDYYHGNPNIYSENDTIRYEDRNLYVWEKWEEDARRTARLESLGYKVYVVWGKDFKTDPYAVIDDIKQWIATT
jgi:G:T-mismatch repair DNA endonuclease (very short patch repair protein)